MIDEEISEETRRAVRSELARQSVMKRWARLSAAERRLAVKPANEARRAQSGRRRRAAELDALIRSMKN